MKSYFMKNTLLFVLFMFIYFSSNAETETLVFQNIEKLKEKSVHLKSAYELNPKDAKTMLEYADVSFLLKRFEIAMPLYIKLDEKFPNTPLYLIRLAKMYSYGVEKNKVKYYLAKINPDDIKNSILLFDLAEAYYNIGLMEENIELMEDALKLFNKISAEDITSN